MEAQGWRNTSVSLLADNIRADNASSPSQDQIRIMDWFQEEEMLLLRNLFSVKQTFC
jgi:hypothetical protein